MGIPCAGRTESQALGGSGEGEEERQVCISCPSLLLGVLLSITHDLRADDQDFRARRKKQKVNQLQDPAQ